MYQGMPREMWMPPPPGPEMYPGSMPPMAPGHGGPGPGSAGTGHEMIPDMNTAAPPPPPGLFGVLHDHQSTF